MDIQNAQFNKFGTIDCEIKHFRYGWIPFTANPNDVEILGRQVFDAAKDTAKQYVAPLTPSEEEVTLTLANQTRNKRNALLSASDWTQVADAPVDQAAWATYRQSLRDIPQQPGFPHNVAWPVKP